METITQTESLFQEVQALYKDYKSKIHPSPYNIFRVLELEEKEVFLHSRFIADLLNPKGAHGKGSAFLELFLRKIDFREDSRKSITVTREKHKIDILIEAEEWVILIENKVYHTDRVGQIKEYYEKLVAEHRSKPKKIYILYLNLYGDEPKEHSYNPEPKKLEELSVSESILSVSKSLEPNKIYCISYGWDIYSWIEKCMETIQNQANHIADTDDILYKMLNQYKEVLEINTGAMNEEFITKLVEVLKKGDNFRFVEPINKAFEALKEEVENTLWEEIETALSPQIIKNKLVDGYYSYYSELCEIKNVKIYFWVFISSPEDGSCIGIGLVNEQKDKTNEVYQEIRNNPAMNCKELKICTQFDIDKINRRTNFSKKS